MSMANIPWRSLTGATVAAGVLIALGEVNRPISQVVLGDGRTTSPTALTASPFASPHDRQADWTLLLGAPDQRVGGWLVAYALLDMAFALLYGYLGWRLVWAHPPGQGATVSAVDLLRARWWRWAGTFVMLGAGFDLVESALQCADKALLRVGIHLSLAPALLPYETIGKWSLLAAGLVASVGALRLRRPTRRPTARRVISALRTHRFSLFVVVPLAVLGLGAGSVLDQLPDVQRQWADADGPHWHILWAVVSGGLVSVCLLALGRFRTFYVFRRSTGSPVPGPTDKPILWPWFVGPGVAVAGAAVTIVSVRVTGADAPVNPTPLAIFCLVPLAIGIGSWCIRRRKRTFVSANGVPTQNPRLPRWLVREPARSATAGDVAMHRVVGDVIAVSALVVPGLSLLRSFVGEVTLEGVQRPWALVLLGCGVAMSLGMWWTANLGLGVLDWFATSRPASSRWQLFRTPDTAWRAVPFVTSTLSALTFMGLALVVFVVMTYFTDRVSAALGVVATLQFCLLAIALLVGATVVLYHVAGPPEVFWTPPLRTHSVPVATLLLLTMLLAGLPLWDTSVHPWRTTPAGGDSRPTAEQTFEAWVRTNVSPQCASKLPGTPHAVQPLFLYAAEGGGIRAARWTAMGLDRLQRESRCTAALMSSGASGGAVGLAVAQLVTQPADTTDTASTTNPATLTNPAGGTTTTAPATPQEPIGAAVDRIRGPNPLASTGPGLLLADVLYAATGVPSVMPGQSWRDRAAHMEDAWGAALDGMTTPFVAGQPVGTVTGALVLNSSATNIQCRALVSQVNVLSPASAGDCSVAGAVPGSIDLLSPANGCAGDLTRATAAMTAARFPFVTPNAAVTCHPRGGSGTTQLQLGDGGYIENTGIGTLVDLADQWLPDVRRYNDQVVTGERTGPLLLPTLVYFDNGTGSDIAQKSARPRLEPLVPLLAKGPNAAALNDTDVLLHRAGATFAVSNVIDGCLEHRFELCEALRTWRPTAAYVVFQQTQPAVSAPLGWTLSKAAVESMATGLDGSFTSSSPGVVGHKGYGTPWALAQLLATLKP